jgi:hypothetical protein
MGQLLRDRRLGCRVCLVGLQFVVLIADRPPLRAAEAGAAFATPTIVGAASLLSALVRAPWPTITLATAVCGFGSAAAVYAVIAVRRLRKQSRLSAGVCGLVVARRAAFVGHRNALRSSIGYQHCVSGWRRCGAALARHDKAWDAAAYHVFVNMRDKAAASQQEKNFTRDSP